MQFHRPALLDPNQHHKDEFNSGQTALDDWLHRYAGQNRRGDTAAVWVIVNALNDDALNWWQRFGFEPFNADDADSTDLYLLTSDITKTLSNM